VNFFERQHSARNTSVRLVLLFSAAVIGIVVLIDALVWLLTLRGLPAAQAAPTLIGATVLTVLILAGGTLAKTLSLRAGGSAVALGVGAVPVDPSTTDPTLRRYVNIVEEMALASGVPMPRLFVLEREPGINAFAAGYTPADAAVTVTAGALQTLNRDELQGVIGHEFSHILNGDMRLNIRLIGLLAGILLLGLIGLRLFAFGGGRGGSRRDNSGAVILVLALAMTVLGFVGQFFARLIQAAVSRQREWLADASAVQFTRQTTGLEGALKKIAGLPIGSQLADKHGASQVNHMLFGEAGAHFSALYATHPPLMERIKALDPSFQPAEIGALQDRWDAHPPHGLAEDAALGLVSPTGSPTRTTSAPVPVLVSSTPVSVTPSQITARVGSLSPGDLERGARLSAAIPAPIRQLASQSSTAVAFVLALALNTEPEIRARQLQVIATNLDAPSAQAAAALVTQADTVPPLLRLPVVSMAIPLITARPPATLHALMATLDAVALADGAISVFEYCLTRMVSGYVQDALSPVARSRRGSADMNQVQVAALTLLGEVAAAGNADPRAAEHAFLASVSHLMPGAAIAYTPPSDTWHTLDAGWDGLDSLDPPHKQRVIEAVVVAVRDDGVLSVDEAELLRATCALLHCPLPSLIA
jgi:Zn-dependent protease with chaperone function